MSLTIEAHNLTKRFPPPFDLRTWMPWAQDRKASGTLAVDGVTLGIRRGEIFGLLGPNGAGKTTLVKLLATLILPSEGTATVNGFSLTESEQIRSTIGLVTSNERSFFSRLTCRENLEFYSGLYHLSSGQRERRVRELTSLLDLGDLLDKRYDRCSTGMKQRLALARAMLNEASLLFLDEPTVALDPVAAAQLRECLYGLAHEEDHTVLMVTHNPDEAVELCDRVAIMLQGKLHIVGAPDELRRLLQADGRCELRVRDFSEQLAETLRRMDAVRSLSCKQELGRADVAEVEVVLRDRRRSLPKVLSLIEAEHASLESFEVATASWETVAEQLTAPPQTDTAEPPSVSPTPSQSLPVTVSEELARDNRESVGVDHRTTLWWSRGQELFHAIPLFLRRDARIQARYPLAFALQMVGIFFSIAIFYFVAQVFGLQATPYLQDYEGDYFSFVLIGIAFLGYQGVALYAFSGVVQSAQTMGTLEAMLTTPTRLSTILLASSAWSFVFTSLRVLLYLVAGALLFGADFQDANVIAALTVLILTMTSLAGIGILSASFIMVFKRGNPINFLISSASTLLGGVYYPVAVLPPWLETLARLYPLTYSLQAMRLALLNGATVGALAQEIGLLLAFTVLLLPIGLVSFRAAVRRAKRHGSLTQF